MFVFGSKSKEMLADVEPEMLELCERALKESHTDFSIICGYRSKDEQYLLYEQGLSELDGIMGISSHQIGYAVDILPYVIDENGSILDCWNYNNPKVRVAWLECYRAFLRVARQMNLNLELGLSYIINDTPDYPHIEIKD